nr:LysM domain receptor-like kinase 3 [Tanacetum cinerariifolium]
MEHMALCITVYFMSSCCQKDDYNENQRVQIRNESFVQSSSYKFELIGYGASDDELFLIYEYAQKGSLGSHIHDPQSKCHPTISWIMRVQIALDTSRGLECIHEHTKPHY